MRPLRHLIMIINGFPKEVIAEVSPYTAVYIRPITNLPMILIMGVCGIQSGISSTSAKFLGELLENGGFTQAPLLSTSFMLIAISSAIFLIYALNLTMKYYD